MTMGRKREGLAGESTRRVRVWKGFGRGEALLAGEDRGNCSLLDGILRRGVGILPLKDGEGYETFTTLLSEVTGVYTVDGSSFFLTAADGKAYSLDTVTGRATALGGVGDQVAFAPVIDDEGNAYACFVGSEGGLVVKNGVATALAFSGVRFAVVCKGRLFAAKGRGVVYSAAYEPLQFGGGASDGGELLLPPSAGEVIALAATEEAAYLLTSSEIYRLQVSANGMEQRLEKLACELKGILPASAIGLGEGVLFMARDGVYRIDGEKVLPVLREWNIRAKEGTSCAVGRCDSLALFDYTDERGATRRLAVSADGKACFFADRHGRLGGNGNTCVGNLLYRFALCEEGGEYRSLPKFESKPFDFGTEGLKTIRSLTLSGLGEMELRLWTDGVERSFAVRFVDGRATVTPRARGRKFRLTLLPYEGSEAYGVSAEYFL